MRYLRTKHYTKRWHGILLFTFIWFFSGLFVNASAEEEGGIDGYSSVSGGLEDSTQSGKRERVYTLEQIHSLRKAVSPGYVRILDWREYGQNEAVMKKGILLTYEGYRKKGVFLAGNFNNWKPIPMVRNSMGVYYHILEPGQFPDGKILRSYDYRFLVDGIWTSDPMNKNRIDDGMGGYISTYYLESSDVDRQVTVRVLQEISSAEEKSVEFRIYLPNIKTLSLVGDFNDWNPEHDILQKGEDGIFRLRKKLRPGGYVYKYIADGKWILDRFNRETRYSPGMEEIVSFLMVPR